MLFYLHYVLMTSGLSGTSVLLAVFFKTYTDASQGEIGVLLMSFPFVCLFIKPLFCSMADRQQAHRLYLLLALLVEVAGYMPFAVIPFFPNFYTRNPRAAWYVLVVACHLGNSGLNVAWSLGDCLAINHAQRTGVPFGRMRLMGTLSWGIYGFIIGQINEVEMLPKYVPAFLILHTSLFFEILMVALWKKDDFEMFDPLANIGNVAICEDTTKHQATIGAPQLPVRHLASNNEDKSSNFVESIPSSLGGTLKLNYKTASVFRDVLASDELHKRLKAVESSQQQQHVLSRDSKPAEANAKCELGLGEKRTSEAMDKNKIQDNTKKNPQLILLRMIFIEDGRVIKYVCLFTVFGLMIAPLNFMFLSMEELCSKRGYNFSQLAGAVLISQALIETFAFLVVPWCMRYISKSTALSAGFVIMSLKWIFYSGWYYSADISPYWAVVSEWSHGLSYGIFCTILADVSLEFANESRLFIPELRKLGFLSDAESTPRERIEAEEQSIKMALRATMQALFSGFMDGLGQGVGALLCGVLVEMYSYVYVWQVLFGICVAVFVLHLLAEVTRSRWSDTYKPHKGTKAFEIIQLSRAYLAESKTCGKQKLSEASPPPVMAPPQTCKHNEATGIAENC